MTERKDIWAFPIWNTARISEAAAGSFRTREYLKECFSRFKSGDFGAVSPADNVTDLETGTGSVLGLYPGKYYLEQPIAIEATFKPQRIVIGFTYERLAPGRWV